MATIDLGKIKLVWRGTYVGGTDYTVDDVVQYTDGDITSSFICTTNSTGNAPSTGGTVHGSWSLMAKGQPQSFNANDITNDISTLALRQSTNENKGAYNTNSMYVDVFQDATGYTNGANTNRNASEYVDCSSETTSNIDIDSSDFSTYFGTQAQNSATQGFMLHQISGGAGLASSINAWDVNGSYTTMSAGSFANHMADVFGNGNFGNGTIAHTFTSGNSYYFLYRFKDGTTFKPTRMSLEWANGSSGNQNGYFFACDSSMNVTQQGSTLWSGGNPTNGNIYNQTGISGSVYYPIVGFKTDYNTNNGGGFEQFYLEGSLKSGSFNATGNFTCPAITAPSTITKMGAIITYQDNAGTNALNTDIVLQVSADNGSNYATATLTAMPDFSTGTKMAKVNDVTVTGGTQLKYKISFANQASGSKEARIRGVSLMY